jgi:phosphoribosylformylglycinamidine cyclo-ligase
LKRVTTYREAGVDVEAGNRFVDQIRPFVQSTLRPEVLRNFGGFAGAFSIGNLGLKNPILITSTDGVGTKLKLAFMTGIHDTIGTDLVAMCVNDIIVCGAEPLFFLDYFVTGKLKPEIAVSVVKGIAAACKEVNCTLIGGETAEMPDFYSEGEYDLAGFVVGAVENDRLIDGSSITVGDQIVGIASSGLHSNGFSLVRKLIFDQLGHSVDDTVEGFRGTVGQELLTPTKLYHGIVQSLMRDYEIGGIANITGGGLIDNIPRVLPERCKARLFSGTWDVHPVFTYMQEQGGIRDTEMLRTFNMGIGLAVICRKNDAESIIERLSGMGEPAWVIGEIAARTTDEPKLEIE